jgi:hypothetical protein
LCDGSDKGGDGGGIVLVIAAGKTSPAQPGIANAPTSGCPKVSQASLYVENPYCPSILNTKLSEARTHWTLSKVADTGLLTGPAER